MIKPEHKGIIHIRPEGEYRHENPYSADIVHTSNGDDKGREVVSLIRFQPPLQLSSDYLSCFLDGTVTEIHEQMVGRQASLYVALGQGFASEQLVKEAVQDIINEAGALVSDNIFASGLAGEPRHTED